MSTTLYLIRHGATAANLAKPSRLQGRGSDIPLAPDGIRQAEAARDQLASLQLAAVFTSPLQRARQTAEIIALPHGFAPTVVEGLTECDVGEWEGMTWDEVRDRYPDEHARYMADQANVPYRGGESFRQAHERSRPVIESLARRYPGRAIAIVSHHVILRTFLAAHRGIPLGRARSDVVIDNGTVHPVELG